MHELPPGAVEWLDSRMASEADLDAAEVKLQKMERAEECQPLPLDVDLFGEKVDKATRRKIKSARQELSHFRRKAALAGIGPLDVMFRIMLRKYERGDMDGAFACAKELAPYMAPRLSAMAIPQMQPGAGGGTVRVTWESEPVQVLEAEP